MAKTHSGLYKSNTHEWWTPPQVWQATLDFIGEEKFICDPCSPSSPNIPADLHYTEKEDGLVKPWPKEGHLWVNPPYGQALKKWIIKCYDHFKENPSCVIWLLIPARVENGYYHKFIFQADTFTFLFEGKLKFGKNGVFEGPAPFPVQLSCFSPRYSEYAQRFEGEFPFKGTVMVHSFSLGGERNIQRLLVKKG